MAGDDVSDSVLRRDHSCNCIERILEIPLAASLLTWYSYIMLHRYSYYRWIRYKKMREAPQRGSWYFSGHHKGTTRAPQGHHKGTTSQFRKQVLLLFGSSVLSPCDLPTNSRSRPNNGGRRRTLQIWASKMLGLSCFGLFHGDLLNSYKPISVSNFHIPYLREEPFGRNLRLQTSKQQTVAVRYIESLQTSNTVWSKCCT